MLCALKAINDARIEIVQHRAPMVQHDQRHTAARARFTIGETGATAVTKRLAASLKQFGIAMLLTHAMLKCLRNVQSKNARGRNRRANDARYAALPDG